MVDHFMDNVIRKSKINGLAKAMVVTKQSQKCRVKYKRAFDKYLADTGNHTKQLLHFRAK